MKTTDKLYVPPYLFTKEDLTLEVTNWFNKAVKYDTFMYVSTENKKIIGYGYSIPFELLIKVSESLSKDLNLNITAEQCYCGHGPFNGIVIWQ